MKAGLKTAVFAALVGSAGMVRADLTTPLGNITPSAQTSFSNPSVWVGTTTVVGPVVYNFLDKFNFSLVTPAEVASIVATINFTAGSSGPPLFGISDLQVNLLQVLPSSSLVAVSWLTVTTDNDG